MLQAPVLRRHEVTQGSESSGQPCCGGQAAVRHLKLCLPQGLLQHLMLDPGPSLAWQARLESKGWREEEGTVATRPSQCHKLKVVQHA